jgi:hypothetical protein
MTQTPTTPAGVTPATAPGTENPQATTPAAQTPAVQSWDEWLAGQSEAQRKQIGEMYDKKNAGMKTALDGEREERRKLEKQVRDLAKAQEAGSDLQNKLTAMADQLSSAERRADFYRDANKADIVDAEGAWVIANAKPDEFFDRRGNLNVTLLKERHPGLFAQPKPTPKINAGNGTQNPDGNRTADMNTFIRRAAGKQ